MTADPLEIIRLSAAWSVALGEFFSALCNDEKSKWFHPHDLTQSAANILATYRGLDLYYIVTEAGRVVAYGMLRGWDEGYQVPSVGIAIHPQDRERGIGRVLMHFLHAVARSRGAKRIRLKVYRENTVAIKIYQSLGYSFECSDADEIVGFLDE